MQHVIASLQHRHGNLSGEYWKDYHGDTVTFSKFINLGNETMIVDFNGAALLPPSNDSLGRFFKILQILKIVNIRSCFVKKRKICQLVIVSNYEEETCIRAI